MRNCHRHLETPVSLFLKLSGGEPSFLLESVDGERIARYSFLGVGPGVEGRQAQPAYARTRQAHRRAVAYPSPKLSPSAAPGRRARRAARGSGAVGVVPLPTCRAAGRLHGYDVVRQFERLPDAARDVLGVPDAVYMFADTLVVFDHARHRLLVIANLDPAIQNPKSRIQNAYEDALARIKTIVARLRTSTWHPTRSPNAPRPPATRPSRRRSRRARGQGTSAR